MKKHINTFTSYFALLTSLMLSSAAQAHLHPKMLKGITAYFKAGMTHYSPVIGMAALESGLAHDFRFYGNFDAAQKKDASGELTEERLYSADKPHMFGEQKDAVFTLLHTLFRSPAGTLAPHTAGGDLTNFHSIATPKKVATLLNYVQELTQLPQPFTIPSHISAESTKAKNLKAKHERALIEKTIALKAKHKKILLTGEDAKNRKGLTTAINEVFNAVEASVLQEVETDSKKKFLYPAHTTEQLILAYFCQKFNDQKDVLELVAHLNNNIVDPEKHEKAQQLFDRLNRGDETAEDLLTAENLEQIAAKLSYTIDDVYALTHAHLFEVQLTPYGNQDLISNAPCYVYDRKNNQQLAVSYADCGETTARHFINLIAYKEESEESKGFDFTSLFAHMKGKTNPYFGNFIEFYKDQTPDHANDGTIDIRSKWNHVVGDLNDPADPIQIRYLKKQDDVEYELDPGIINLLHAFDKIFSLSLEPLESTASFESKKTWIKTSLTKLYKTIKPDYKCTFDLSRLEDDLNNPDVQGAFSFTVQDQNHKNLFSFDFSAQPTVHSNIKTLKVLQDYEGQRAKYKQSLQDKVDKTTFQGVAEDIWLATGDKGLIQHYVHEPLYKLLDHKLDDNNSKIAFLETMFSDYKTIVTLSSLQKAHIKQISRNVLKTLSWEDNYVFDDVNPVLKDLFTLPKFEEIFAYDEIQRVSSNKGFENLKELYKDYKNLKYINIRDRAIEEFVLSSKDLSWTKRLKNFIIRAPKLKKFILNDDAPNLTKLDLNSNSSLERIENIEYLTNLSNLVLSLTSNLEELIFKKSMNKLHSIELQNSGIKKLVGLENLTALKTLQLSRTENIEELIFSNQMNQLDSLELRNSHIKELKGIEYLTALKTLKLDMTTNLKKLEFTTQMDKLEALDLSESGIEVINGSKYLNNLAIFNIGDTQLGDDSLKDMDMKNLRQLSLRNCKNISSLNFEENNKELSLDLTGSGITERSQIKGIEFLDETKIRGLMR